MGRLRVPVCGLLERVREPGEVGVHEQNSARGDVRCNESLKRAPSIPDRQCFADAPTRCGFGPVQVQPWINQPLAPFFNVNVICAASRIATPFSL